MKTKQELKEYLRIYYLMNKKEILKKQKHSLRHYSKNNKCIICNTLITNSSRWCHSCSTKLQLSIPKNHPNYKHGNNLNDKNVLSVVNTYTHRQHVVGVVLKKGELSHTYIHGKGYAPYTHEFNETLRKKIRNRDNNICICGMSKKEHFDKYNRNLEIHHIDYNKSNCEENNLITVCKKCNIKANSNRDYWKKYLKEILNARITG